MKNFMYKYILRTSPVVFAEISKVTDQNFLKEDSERNIDIFVFL